MKSIFIFRRDHRLVDNIGLIETLKSKNEVIPIFIFDPKQVSEKNKYKSTNAIQFMCESLKDLDGKLRKKGSKLRVFFGDPEKVIEKLLKKDRNITEVCVNEDYTNYSRERDAKIEKVCKKNKVEFKQYEDYLLYPMGTIMKDSENPYTVYTYFYKTALGIREKIPKPQKNEFRNYLSNKSPKFTDEKELDTMFQKFVPKINNLIWVHGGRDNAKKIFRNYVPKIRKKYPKTRDIPSEDTTNLSAYIHYGNVSIRECFYCFGPKNSSLNAQLFWREYYYYINYYFPRVIGSPYYEKYQKIKWENNPKWFTAWKKGKTGFPIVDAGMRQLAQTGYTHNRIRMTVASFVIKDLLIDWQKAEKFYAQSLTDYSIAVNNGNWQWIAGTGGSKMEYYRVFNPWEQSKKYDPDCKYIKKYIPELKDVPPKDIHKWAEKYSEYPKIKYPKPIIDHSKRKEIYLREIKKIK